MNRDKNTPSVSMTTAYGTIYADVMNGMIRFAKQITEAFAMKFKFLMTNWMN